MTLELVARDGLVLLGCGKMGTALLTGWLAAGVPAASVWVIEPHPTDWLKSLGVHLNAGIPPAPAVALIAVKPQMMGAALPALQALGNGKTLFVSIAAGTSIASFAAAFGAQTPIVVILFGQQLLAQGVKGDELSGQDARLLESLGHQHDLANQLEIRHHHGAWSKMRTLVLKSRIIIINKKYT